MASVNLSPIGNGITFFGPTALPLAGGQIFTYLAGSSTPLSTYTNVNGNIANTNPIVLGTDGKLPNELWLQAGYSYKFIVEDAFNNVIDTYDNIAGILTQIPTSTATVPTGCILIWSGSVGSIPTGFNLCDGTNGTPDLRNSFIIGAGNSYAIGQTGGTADSIVVSHTHTASSSVTDPGHVHPPLNGSYFAGPSGSSQFNGPNYNSAISATTGSAVTGISVATTVNSAGVSGVNANLPPYYALAYIMKT